MLFSSRDSGVGTQLPPKIGSLVETFLLSPSLKKLFRLFLDIAPLYKKQNRLIFKTGFLISGFLLYLPSHSIFKHCLELDVHHMTSQILSILIDFIQDRAYAIFSVVFKSLNLNNSGTENDIGLFQKISTHPPWTTLEIL